MPTWYCASAFPLSANATIALTVPAARVAQYQQMLGPEVSVIPDQWTGRIAAARAGSFDLMSGIDGGVGPQFDFKTWRWPLALAALLVTVNLAAMNTEWLRLKHEADSIRNSMLQSFKTGYPKETAIIDPLAQMRQKINASKTNSGQSAPDDFTALAAATAEVLASIKLSHPTLPALAELDYRDRSLILKFKPDGEVPTDAFKAALTERKLALTPTPGGAWQIRSMK